LLWKRIIRGLPFFAFAFVVLGVAWLTARLFAAYTRKLLRLRKVHPLLSDVMARGIGLFCLLLGLYFVLKLLGLSTIALTILGGTGLLGIILGIAFRDITENLLASILLSVQSPFRNNDLIEIEGITGYVQALTIRATILISLEGYQVQIPNATVYKSNIFNYTSNPNRREDFIVGIGYDETISHAQKAALCVLEKHPAILADPEPSVLVENLASTTVNLRVFFWIDSSQYNWRKVKSSVIRLVKRAFQDEGIKMPGNEVELNFLNDLSVILPEQKNKKPRAKKKNHKRHKESEHIITDAEGKLSSEMEEIQKQARLSRPIDRDENLLNST
jgi:small conductance mechanosensitive channel